MQAQAVRGTGPEVALRRAMRRLGLRPREHRVFRWGRVRRTIDFAFPRLRVAVEVHGCYWHACPRHSKPVKSNADWWSSKLGRNAARDRDTARRLRSAGWSVVTVWEHEEPARAARRVLRVVDGRRTS